MAITAVNLVTESWEDEKDGSRTYFRGYDVHSDDPDEDMVTVRLALPLPWDADGTDGAAIVVRRRARRDEGTRLLWRGEVEWGWAPEDQDEEEDPLDEPPKIRGTFRGIQIPIIEDNNGDAIVNSAGDYPDPPPEVERFRYVATIQWNVATKPANMRNIVGRVNSGSITVDGETAAAGRARIAAADVSEVQVKNDVTYRTITVVIEILDDDEPENGFDMSILDQGYRKKVGTEQIDILIEDDDGNMNRPSSPVLLDGMGDLLADPDVDTAVFIDFTTTSEMDFSIFPGVS